MIRGDIYAIAGAGDFSGKPLPGLVVQSDVFNEFHPTVTMCPLTSQLTGDGIYRIAIAPDVPNGLRAASEIEIDKVQAVWTKRLGQRIGHADDTVMEAVDFALRRWFDL